MNNEQKKKQLKEYKGEDQIISFQELLKDLDGQKPGTKVSTGIPPLDEILDGVESGELIVISGPTGQGKTTLAITITKRIAQSTRIAWFTLEVTQRQFADKIGRDAPVFWLPKKNIHKNLAWITDRIIEAVTKFGVQTVFIDHIGMLETQEQFYGEHRLELKYIVGKLKELAIELDIVIFLLAHITEDTAQHAEPHHNQIRDSKDIAHLCDTFICIWRVDEEGPYGDEKRPSRRRYELFGSRSDSQGLNSVRAKIKVTKNRRSGKLGWFYVEKRGDFLQELDLFNQRPTNDEQTEYY